MKSSAVPPAERILILAPRGRDALVAKEILRDAKVHSEICVDLGEVIHGIECRADIAVITEEATRGAKMEQLGLWVASQPTWSDFPFILLTEHGGGLERNPGAARLTEILGNVIFLERPFHPTTLISAVRTGLRGRQRQYEWRRLNEELELRIEERTAELGAANRQLHGQIQERERVESTLRQMQRLEAVGQLTSGVSHDFNNLLTVILGNIGFLEKDLAAEHVNGKISQRLSYMRAAAERGAKLTDQLLSFSRRQRLEPRSLDLNEIVAGMRDLLQSTMGGSIHIETRHHPALWPALVDPTQLELAILNLAINARDAMNVGGTLEVSTRNATLGSPTTAEDPPAGEYVSVRVTDNGSGMSDEIRAKVFEPFFTTKEVGKGSGLGLSQVLGFAKQSGGGVSIESRPGSGTSVDIYLPRAQAERVNPVIESALTSEIAAAGGSTILLIDDDNAVREVTRTMLHELGYLVLEAGSGGAALELLDREGQIDLIIVDFAMPGMNGADVARQALARRPRLPVLFVTGFADRSALGGISETQIVSKPFVNDELARKVRVALAGGVSAKVVRLRP